jgi:GNAT superfamily N-acetyltransferase
MPFGLPNVSYIGYPVALPCRGHAGLGIRQATRADADALVAHFLALDRGDLWMRFCATLNPEAIRRHVDGLWDGDGVVLAALDGPLWAGPLHRAGPIRALAELMLANGEAELGISVETSMRRRGIGTYLLQTGACLLAARGIGLIRATTMPDNVSFIAMAQSLGGSVSRHPDLVEVAFEVAALKRGYLRRRAAEALGRRARSSGEARGA